MDYLESLEYEVYEGDPEWEGSGAAALEFETNRSSPIYIAWVQHTLNQLINANLGVDGDRGAKTIAAVRRLAPSKKIERKLLYDNAKKMFRL